jgi:hypothetical protein
MRLRRITAKAGNSHLLIRLSIEVWGVPERESDPDAPLCTYLHVLCDSAPRTGGAMDSTELMAGEGRPLG